jgi:hypothetical protein
MENTSNLDVLKLRRVVIYLEHTAAVTGQPWLAVETLQASRAGHPQLPLAMAHLYVANATRVAFEGLRPWRRP